jgi:hypothetical protein
VFGTNVEVPSNTAIESSIAGENAFGKGGGVQFRLLERIPETNYTNFRFLPEVPLLPPPILDEPMEPILPFEEPPIMPLEESVPIIE